MLLYRGMWLCSMLPGLRVSCRIDDELRSVIVRGTRLMVRLDGLRWRRLLCCCRCFLLVWWLLQRPWRVLFCVLAWHWPLRLRDTVRGRGCEKVLVGIVRSGGGLLISAGGAGVGCCGVIVVWVKISGAVV